MAAYKKRSERAKIWRLCLRVCRFEGVGFGLIGEDIFGRVYRGLSDPLLNIIIYYIFFYIYSSICCITLVIVISIRD